MSLTPLEALTLLVIGLVSAWLGFTGRVRFMQRASLWVILLIVIGLCSLLLTLFGK